MKRRFLAASILALLTAPALAAPVDFSKPLKTPAGVGYTECAEVEKDKPPKEAKCIRWAPVTLGAVAKVALDALHGDVATQKVAYRILKSLVDEKPIELTTDDQKIIVDAIWSYRSAMHARGVDLPLSEIAAAVEMINPADVK